jgi:dTDP-4-amino-4,6-dideoxygalactose transaminase
MDRLPLARPSLGPAEEAQVLEVLRSGWLTRGPKVAELETAVAKYLGVDHAVAVSSGTAALHLALAGVGVGPGDEVLLPDFTFPATANAVRHCGARPILLDIDPETLNLSVPALRAFAAGRVRRIEGVARDAATRARVAAIMPVHLFGLPADMDAVLEVAADLRLAVVEDAAACLGARWSGRFCGTIGVAGCISFHPRKVVTTGEGGMVVTNTPSVADRVRQLRNHGTAQRDGVVTFEEPGYNLRMGDLAAAVGVAQMARIDELLAGYEAVARRYDEALARVPGVRTPPRREGRSYQAYVVRLARGIDRDAVIRDLRARGIESSLGTYAISAQPAYADHPACEASIEAQATTLALPFFVGMTDSDVRRVAGALREAVAGARR